jgi:hypothetical protein
MWQLCQHCIMQERNEEPDGIRIVLHVCVRIRLKSNECQNLKSWISYWAFANLGFFLPRHKIKVTLFYHTVPEFCQMALTSNPKRVYIY